MLMENIFPSYIINLLNIISFKLRYTFRYPREILILYPKFSISYVYNKLYRLFMYKKA